MAVLSVTMLLNGPVLSGLFSEQGREAVNGSEVVHVLSGRWVRTGEGCKLPQCRLQQGSSQSCGLSKQWFLIREMAVDVEDCFGKIIKCDHKAGHGKLSILNSDSFLALPFSR